VTLGAAVAVAAKVPVDIGRDEARTAARRELADPAYHTEDPSLLERALTWLFDRLTELLGDVTVTGPMEWTALIVLVALIVAAGIAVRLRTGGFARSARTAAPVFGDTARSAAEHRRLADDAAGRGDWETAVRERFRAIVRDLEERHLLDPRPGRTADEAADEAGALLPDHAPTMRSAARVFDDVVYGGRAATREIHEQLAGVDESVRAARALTAGAIG
jgi:hypothetical protein